LPFYSANAAYQPITSIGGAFSQTFYDTLGRIVGQLNPERTWSKAIYSPWASYVFDAGRTIALGHPSQDKDVGHHFLLLEKDAPFSTWYELQTQAGGLAQDVAAKSAVYKDRRLCSIIDPASRTICKVEQAGAGIDRTIRYTNDKYGYRVETVDAAKDIQTGDILNRVIERKVFNCIGVCIQTSGIDSGITWVVPNTLGGPIFSGNARGIFWTTAYDPLHREKDVLVTRPGQPETLCKANTYGDQVPQAEKANLIGRLWQIKDQSGITTYSKYDVNGNVTDTTTQFRTEYKSLADWKQDWKQDVELSSSVFISESKFNNYAQNLEERDIHGTVTRKMYTRFGTSSAWNRSLLPKRMKREHGCPTLRVVRSMLSSNLCVLSMEMEFKGQDLRHVVWVSDLGDSHAWPWRYTRRPVVYS
jgi:hypothetical protein